MLWCFCEKRFAIAEVVVEIEDEAGLLIQVNFQNTLGDFKGLFIPQVGLDVEQWVFRSDMPLKLLI